MISLIKTVLGHHKTNYNFGFTKSKVFLYSTGGDTVIRKPLRSVLSQYVTDEFNKSGLSMREFAKKHGISLGVLQKLLDTDVKGFNVNTVDKILTGFDKSF